jgi:diguanylate cyclase (GGDEF)-like protein/PAS domain S-box-containing protein
MGHAVKESMAPYHEQRSRVLLAGTASSALLLLVTYLKFISARQQRQTAQRLADNEERWRLALEAAGDGVWDWDIAAQRILYSTGWIAMIGHQPEEISDQIEEWKKRIHPEDLSQALQALDQHLTGHSNAYVNEHRILCKGGHWKWMLDRGMVIARDLNGAPLRMVGTHTDISARKRLEEELRILATTDALTGLCNRRCFLEELHAEFERFKRYPASQAGVLMLDIDFFKKINDQHGHAIGDAALRHFGALLHSVLRRTDIAGRLGGEEFAVILMEINLENAMQFATRLCAHVRHHPLVFEGRTISMSVSIGLSMLQRDDEHSETVLHRADRALYQAKLGGRDRLVVDDPAAPQTQAPGELQRQEDAATAPPGVRPRAEAATAADPGSPAARPGSPTSG